MTGLYTHSDTTKVSPDACGVSEVAGGRKCIWRSVRATVPASGEPLFRVGVSHCDVLG